MGKKNQKLKEKASFTRESNGQWNDKYEEKIIRGGLCGL